MSFFTRNPWPVVLLLALPSLMNTMEARAELKDLQFLSPRLEDAPTLKDEPAFDGGSARSVARPWSQLRQNPPLSRLPSASTATLQSMFQTMRSSRFLSDPSRPSFARRLTWLYPDDGCYMRADRGVRFLRGQGYSSPAKIFAFGHLRVNTPNHPRGRVGWWYHVAPGMRVGSTIYVLDPALQMYQAVTIDSWLAKMSASPSSIRVAICRPGAYGPSSTCAGGSLTEDDELAHIPAATEVTGTSPEWVGPEEMASASPNLAEFLSTVTTKFLRLEWNRQRTLGRDPNKVLGASPPWTFAGVMESFRGFRTESPHENRR